MRKKISCALPIAIVALSVQVFAITPDFIFAEDPSAKNVHVQQVRSQISSADYIPYRILSEKDMMGFSVRTDDGAVWMVKDEISRYNVREWRANDTLVIHPCWSPFWAGGTFFLENERTKTTATVDLTLSPYTSTDSSVYLSFIDAYSSEIFVTDAFNRRFKLFTDPSDYYTLASWHTGDFIIFGSNQNCCSGLFSLYPYIIINIHTREFIRASMANY